MSHPDKCCEKFNTCSTDCIQRLHWHDEHRTPPQCTSTSKACPVHESCAEAGECLIAMGVIKAAELPWDPPDLYRVGEPEDEDDSSTVLNGHGEAMTADEIVLALNDLTRRYIRLDNDLQVIARHRDEYRERAYRAEEAAELAGCANTENTSAPSRLAGHYQQCKDCGKVPPCECDRSPCGMPR